MAPKKKELRYSWKMSKDMRAPRARFAMAGTRRIPTWSITGGACIDEIFHSRWIRADHRRRCFARMHGRSRTCSSRICARWQIERTQSPPKVCFGERAVNLPLHYYGNESSRSVINTYTYISLSLSFLAYIIIFFSSFVRAAIESCSSVSLYMYYFFHLYIIIKV